MMAVTGDNSSASPSASPMLARMPKMKVSHPAQSGSSGMKPWSSGMMKVMKLSRNPNQRPMSTRIVRPSVFQKTFRVSGANRLRSDNAAASKIIGVSFICC